MMHYLLLFMAAGGCAILLYWWNNTGRPNPFAGRVSEMVAEALNAHWHWVAYAAGAAATLAAAYYYALSPMISKIKEWMASTSASTDTTARTDTVVPATSWIPAVNWTEWFWTLLPYLAALAALSLLVSVVRRVRSGGGGAPRAPWFPWRTLFQLMGILLVVGAVAAVIGNWPKVEGWLAANNFSTAEFQAYVTSLDTTAKILFGAAAIALALLGLGAGAKSVLAVGGLAGLFLVLYSVSWSDIKKEMTTWSNSQTSLWFAEGTCDGKLRTIQLTDSAVSINRGAHCYLDLEIPEGPIAIIGEGQVKVMHRPEPFTFRASHWKCEGRSRCTVEAVFCPTGTIWQAAQLQCVRRNS